MGLPDGRLRAAVLLRAPDPLATLRYSDSRSGRGRAGMVGDTRLSVLHGGRTEETTCTDVQIVRGSFWTRSKPCIISLIRTIGLTTRRGNGLGRWPATWRMYEFK